MPDNLFSCQRSSELIRGRLQMTSKERHATAYRASRQILRRTKEKRLELTEVIRKTTRNEWIKFSQHALGQYGMHSETPQGPGSRLKCSNENEKLWHSLLAYAKTQAPAHTLVPTLQPWRRLGTNIYNRDSKINHRACGTIPNRKRICNSNWLCDILLRHHAKFILAREKKKKDWFLRRELSSP